VTRVDSKGRIVIPQEVRDQLELGPGTEVEVRVEDGQIVVDPEVDPEEIIRRTEQLLEEVATERAATPSAGENDDGERVDPIARRHREVVRRGAADSDE